MKRERGREEGGREKEEKGQWAEGPAHSREGPGQTRRAGKGVSRLCCLMMGQEGSLPAAASETGLPHPKTNTVCEMWRRGQELHTGPPPPPAEITAVH